nr:PD40 domain-containing protein [Anaerolineae bacterium]
ELYRPTLATSPTMTRILIRLISSLSFVCIGVVLLALAVGHSVTLADNELIFTAYFATGTNGSLYNIYRMDIAHGLIHPMTTKGNSTAQIDVSPNGQQVVFVRDFGQASALYIMDLQGKNLRQLTDLSAYAYKPTWSPDGRSIVFINEPTIGTPDLYIKDLKSDETHRLTDNNRTESAPTWSPDGKHIVFASDITTPNNMDIFSLDVATEDIQPLIASLVNDTNPIWSPDGRYLMYFTDETKRPALRMMLYDSLKDKTISLFSDSFFTGDTPDWSPDGRYIVYAAFTSFNSSSLFRLDVGACLQQPKTCNAQRLTDAPTFFVSPRWRPNPP